MPKCERCGKRLVTSYEVCEVFFPPSVHFTLCRPCWNELYEFVRWDSIPRNGGCRWPSPSWTGWPSGTVSRCPL